MGKLGYEPHEYYPHQQSKTLKAVNKSMKKSVKITYISSPLLVRTCDASEFRSVVQQLTGKDSNDFLIISDDNPQKKAPNYSNWGNIPPVQDQPTWVMQLQGGDHHARAASTTTMVNSEGGMNGSSSSCYSNNRAVAVDSLEVDEDYLWKEVARSVLQSPCCVLV